MEKITKRDKLTAIIEAAKAGAEFSCGADVIIAFCENEIELLDKKAAKAKERAAVKRAEGDELTVAVEAALGDELESIADITARIDGPDVSVSKVSYRLTQLFKAGKATKGEIKIPASEGAKARTIVGYCKATDAE